MSLLTSLCPTWVAAPADGRRLGILFAGVPSRRVSTTTSRRIPKASRPPPAHVGHAADLRTNPPPTPHPISTLPISPTPTASASTPRPGQRQQMSGGPVRPESQSLPSRRKAATSLHSRPPPPRGWTSTPLASRRSGSQSRRSCSTASFAGVPSRRVSTRTPRRIPNASNPPSAHVGHTADLRANPASDPTPDQHAADLANPDRLRFDASPRPAAGDLPSRRKATTSQSSRPPPLRGWRSDGRRCGAAGSRTGPGSRGPLWTRPGGGGLGCPSLCSRSGTEDLSRQFVCSRSGY